MIATGTVAIAEGDGTRKLRSRMAVVTSTCSVTLNASTKDALTELYKLLLVWNSVQIKVIVDGSRTSLQALDDGININSVEQGRKPHTRRNKEVNTHATSGFNGDKLLQRTQKGI